MKKISTWMIAALMCGAMTSCGFKGSGDSDYVSVQLEDSKMWSLLDVSNGEIVMADEFFAPATNVIKGSFFVENDKKEFDLYNLKDTKNKLNRSSFSVVTNFNPEGFAIVRVKDEPWQIIDTEGKVTATLDKTLNVFSGFSEDGLALIINKDNMVGYVDTKGGYPIKPRYKLGTIFSDGIAFVLTKQENEHNYLSAINTAGETLFTFSDAKYSSIGLFNDGHVFAVEGDHSVLLDKTGKKIMTVCNSTNISNLSYQDGKMIYYDGEFYGVKNTEDKILIRAKYQRLKFQSDGNLIAVNSNGKYGVITPEDDIVMPFDYDVLDYLAPNRYVTQSGSVIVLIDKDGKEICEKAFSNFINRSSSSSEVSLASLISSQNNNEAMVEAVEESSMSSYSLDLLDLSDYEIPAISEFGGNNGAGLLGYLNGPGVNDYPEHFFGTDESFNKYVASLDPSSYVRLNGSGDINDYAIDVSLIMNRYGTLIGRYHHSNGTNLDLNGYVDTYSGALYIRLGHANNSTLSHWTLYPEASYGNGFSYEGTWGKSALPSELTLWPVN